MKCCTTFVIGIALVLLQPLGLSGQDLGVAAGPAFPRGPLADSRAIGFRAVAFVAGSRDLIRTELSYVYFPQSSAPSTSEWQRGSWRTLSVGVNVRPSIFATDRYRVRAVFGVAAHRTSVPDVPNPYGTTAGFQLGFALERDLDRFRGIAETGVHVMASDFGADDFVLASYVPITFGISWSPRR